MRNTENNYDVVIIGGGLGGLVSGAKLSKEGKKVLLLEQHIVVGGCATTYKRKGYTIEVGLHELDGLDKKDLKTKVFKDLGVFDNIEFIKLPEFYRFKSKDLDIVMPDNDSEAIELLSKKFPSEVRGIKKYFKTMNKIRNEIFRLPESKLLYILLQPVFPVFYPYLSVISSRTTKFFSLLHPLFYIFSMNKIFWRHRTIGGYLDSIIRDENLKLLLTANLKYYSDDPYKMSLLYFSVAQASYYKGGYYIKGGSQKLSDYLARVIRDNGGEVLLNSKVSEIKVKNEFNRNKVCGVKYHKTTDSKKTYNVDCKIVISNSAISNVVKMLPTQIGKSLNNKLEKLENSISLLSIYICFKGRVKDLGNTNYSTFIFGNTKSLKNVYSDSISRIEERDFVFVDYSQIDSGLCDEGKSFGSICLVDYYKEWEGISDKAYKKKKEEIAEAFLSRAETLLPGFKKSIYHYEVGTSKTIERYTLNPGGSVYGFSQTPSQSGIYRFKNKISSIKNLYFASAWTMPGGGFSGAILSGWFCAREILRKNKIENILCKKLKT